MKSALWYDPADDLEPKARLRFPAHRHRYEGFHAGANLLTIGAFGDPLIEGALAVFTTGGAAEESAGDLVVLNGAARSCQVGAWNGVVAAP